MCFLSIKLANSALAGTGITFEIQESAHDEGADMMVVEELITKYCIVITCVSAQ